MSIFESILLISTLIVGTTIVISTIRTGISPMPSSKKAYTAMVALADKTGTGPIYDLGSGWGNLVVRLAKKYPHRHIVGYELSLCPWLVSVIIKKCLGLDNVSLYRKDFMKADLSEASVIMCYLFSDAMERLKVKIEQDNAALSFLISNNFILPTYTPSEILQLDDFYKSPVYLYRLK